MKTCPQCEIMHDRARATYCSRACQVAAYRGEDPERSRRRAETGYAWEPVHPPDYAVKVTVPKARPVKTGTWKTALILPDPQIGFRWLADGTLEAFHDERALKIALAVAEAERPDLTIWLGDFLDLAPLGRFRKEETLALTVQPAVEVGYTTLAIFREVTGSMRLLEGNHDARMQLAAIDNLTAAAGLRRAGKPHEWPALSVPNLLRLDDLDIRYVGGYPAGASYINDNLAAIHGSRLDVEQVVADERVSVIQGHIHRIQTRYKTRNSRGKPKPMFAHSPGCLCRVDGAVPSSKSAVDLTHGRPVRHFEDWQQGLCVVRYEEDDGRFALEQVAIHEDTQGLWALHRGGEFRDSRPAR